MILLLPGKAARRNEKYPPENAAVLRTLEKCHGKEEEKSYNGNTQTSLSKLVELHIKPIFTNIIIIPIKIDNVLFLR